MKRRVILQDLRSGRYLSEDDRWVEDCQRAKAFEHTYLALREGISRLDVDCTQLVFCFEDPSRNLYFRIRGSRPTLACNKCPLMRN